MGIFVPCIAAEKADLGVTCFRGDKRAKDTRAVLSRRCNGPLTPPVAMSTLDRDKTRSTSNDNEAPISHRSKRPCITLATTRDVGVFRTLARNRQYWVAPFKRTTSPGGSSSAGVTSNSSPGPQVFGSL
jgi:hypothetical protein